MPNFGKLKSQKIKMFKPVLCVIIVFIGSYSTAAAFRMEAAPSHVVIGVTRYLDVKCVTTKIDDSSMESLISFIISRSTNLQDTNFKELASLTMFTPEVQIKDVSESNLTGSGNIDNNGESFINLVWEYPDATQLGVYKCEAHGIDHTGHPVYFNTSTLVSSSHSDSETLSEHIKALLLLNEQLIAKVNNLTNIQNALNLQLNVQKQLIQRAKPGLFKISPVYNGRRYLIAGKLHSLAAADAELVCNVFGGYLAEVDSEAEHNFIIHNVLDHESYQLAFVSATDEAHENIWINRHSNTSATYFKWNVGQPNLGTEQNCLCFYPPSWGMGDAYCSYKDFPDHFSYICEIPENTNPN